MNKQLSVLIVSVLLITVLLSGCISQENDDTTEQGLVDDFIEDEETGNGGDANDGGDSGSEDETEDGGDEAPDDEDEAEEPGEGDDDQDPGDGSDEDDGESEDPIDIEGGDETNETDDEPGELRAINASLPEKSGWIDSDEGEVEHTEPVNFNEGTLIEITFYIHVEDSDEDHSETDEGSDPDTISASATDEVNYLKDTAQTPGDIILTIKAEDLDTPYLNQFWNVTIWGEDFGGGKPAYFLGFIVWVDQGAAWTLNVNYIYMG